MATNIYTQYTSDGKRHLARRAVKQGRKPQGLTRWNGRLKKESLAALKAEAARLHPYVTVNDLVRIAVDRYVHTELLKP